MVKLKISNKTSYFEHDDPKPESVQSPDNINLKQGSKFNFKGPVYVTTMKPDSNGNSSKFNFSGKVIEKGKELTEDEINKRFSDTNFSFRKK